MQCSGCGYRLEGLTARVCPECAHPFDPADPATFSIPGMRGVAKRVWVLATYPLASWAVLSGASFFFDIRDLFCLGATVSLTLPVGIIGVVAYTMDCWPTHPRMVGLTIALWILALLLIVIDPAKVWTID